MSVTIEQLRHIYEHAPAVRLENYVGAINDAMAAFEINTPKRQSAFLAQVGHESAEFRYMREIWGPTTAQKRYEGRKDLGNTQPGDGKKFMGRGPIQITGRSNYVKLSPVLGVDLEAHPELLEQPEYGLKAAGWFWKTHGLNETAELGTLTAFRLITRRINGGYNGEADREAYWIRARRALGIG